MPQGMEVRDDIVQEAMSRLNPVIVHFGIATFAAVVDFYEFDRVVRCIGITSMGEVL
ncbi:hypothetical protein [Streptomyces sp. NPDC001978]|uniref:hypothetical protein n=1 Tax=Streptomyces sp. NPDC001978 TaxID=3364627 RepID=UPI0036AE4D2B